MASEPLSGLGIGFGAGEGVVKRFSSLVSPSNRKPASPLEEQELLSTAVAEIANDVRAQAERSLGAVGEILEALAMMLEDPQLQGLAAEKIQAGATAENALLESFEQQRNLFLDDADLLVRLDDLADLVNRVVAKMCNCEPALADIAPGSVLVGHSLSAMQAAQLPEGLAGVVLTAGSPSSHAAIILRSRGIPAVIQCPQARELRDGQRLLVDPAGNRVVVAADLSMATALFAKIQEQNQAWVSVLANIGSEGDAILAASTRAEGVGLFRTELSYLEALTAPSFEQQVSDYQKVLTGCPAGVIMARTFDSAPDKPLRFFAPAQKPRYSMLDSGRELLLTQLRALAKAQENSGRQLSVMAPLIADADQAREFTSLARSVLSCPVGVMVETIKLSSEIADLRGVADFISVGSNDLASEILGLNRDAFANHWEPTVIAALASIARSANAIGLPAGVCGESAADPLFAVVLAGLGFGSLSVSAPAVSVIRQAVAGVSPDQAAELAARVLQAQSATEATAIAAEKLQAFGN